ncbi:amino acid ABC transporter permease [uncultured Aeromicrobium sp.]|uniref:amino acid ABC transporter permease n=1 Tax=uncultured Aeromicrobium sp. TaxID=337820 RepID=UPI0025D12E3E|nr:amino acid ABC transporter permease [uncultured Aeromicrobium sp.]
MSRTDATTGTQREGTAAPVVDASMETVPLRHPGRLVAAALILFIVVAGVHSAWTNENFEWGEVGNYLFHPQIMAGLRRTIILTVVSMAIGIVLGVALATARMSSNPVLAAVAGAYLWFFRGTPLLVQLIFWYNLSALYPRIGLAVPFGGPEIAMADTNAILSVWFVAILGLSLNEGAYMAEIIRGGLLSVPRHQTEAAQALGMGRWLTFRRIVLPQALRIIVPPTGNQVIGMLKTSALVSIIALPDLLYSAQLIYSQNFKTIPLLIVVSLWYLALTTLLSYGQQQLERRFGRGVSVTPRTPLLRLPRRSGSSRKKKELA